MHKQTKRGMLFRIKIQTAILIMVVFAFRLIYANVCISEGQQNTRTSQFISLDFKSTLKKRRRAQEAIVSNKVETNRSQEVFEEIPDNEEDPLKDDAPVVLSYLYSSTGSDQSVSSRSDFFVHHNYSLLSKKYLTYSILRI